MPGTPGNISAAPSKMSDTEETNETDLGKI